LEARRLRALKLLEEGRQPGEVARLLGVDRRNVRLWKAKARAGGPEALRARKASGRPPKLSARQRQTLCRDLIAGAVAAGFPTDLWTAPRVAKRIRQRFGVTYHPAHVTRLLRQLGFTPQKPERRARERNEAEIARWAKVEGRRIKKKPVKRTR
jgi:transposase